MRLLKLSHTPTLLHLFNQKTPIKIGIQGNNQHIF